MCTFYFPHIFLYSVCKVVTVNNKDLTDDEDDGLATLSNLDYRTIRNKWQDSQYCTKQYGVLTHTHSSVSLYSIHLVHVILGAGGVLSHENARCVAHVHQPMRITSWFKQREPISASLAVGKHGAVLCLISLGSFGFFPPPSTFLRKKRREFAFLRRC